MWVFFNRDKNSRTFFKRIKFTFVTNTSNYENIEHPYFLREKYNGDLIEKQKVSNGIHFKLENNLQGDSKLFSISSIKSTEKQVHNNILKKVNQLNDIVKNETYEQLDEIFDLNYLSEYFLYVNITGRNDFSSFRWVYRMTNGKIYPIATSHNTFKRFNIDREPVWRLILKNNSFRTHLLDWISNWKKLPSENEIKTVVNKYASSLSNYNKNINQTQRELNYRLRKDAKIMISKINKLKEFIFGIKTVNSKNIRRGIDEKTTTQLGKLGFTVNNSNVIIAKGIYKIENNIIIPKGYKLIIDSGVELHIGKNISILVNDEIQIRGIKDEKVIIKGEKNNPFGVVASIGNGSQNSIVEYLDISYGSEAYIEGKYLSGAFCFYHQNVSLNNVACFSNYADDGLNVKYGNIEISNCNFYNNWADQIDLDFCSGIIENTGFSSNKGDSNGDGLDLSGSTIKINNSHFDNFNDKGLSVGENSIVQIENSFFQNNNNAISIKDLSRVTVKDNFFKNNQVVFNLYMKKRIFGGGTLDLGNNMFESNVHKIKKDNLSNVCFQK